MPIYDYSCTACHHLVEVIHGMTEPGPRFCPNCGTEGTMRKGFATPAIHYKGSGWAKKDRSAIASSGRPQTAKPSASADQAVASNAGDGGSATPDGSGSGDSSNASDSSSTSRSATKHERPAVTSSPDGGS
ncbi:MAG: zinc ribbon domain-containing protein [Chloroflexi bacterium]|nr:zinc ribbon domain-containing protein [Chloroflexota bacterium]